MDKSGQIRDKDGNLLLVKNRVAKLKFNQKIEDDLKVKNLAKVQKIRHNKKLALPFRDSNLVLGTNRKRTKKSMLGLQFL